MWLPNPHGAEGTEHRVHKSSPVKAPQKSSTAKENMPLAFVFAEKNTSFTYVQKKIVHLRYNGAFNV